MDSLPLASYELNSSLQIHKHPKKHFSGLLKNIWLISTPFLSMSQVAQHWKYHNWYLSAPPARSPLWSNQSLLTPHLHLFLFNCVGSVLRAWWEDNKQHTKKVQQLSLHSMDSFSLPRFFPFTPLQLLPPRSLAICLCQRWMHWRSSVGCWMGGRAGMGGEEKLETARSDFPIKWAKLKEPLSRHISRQVSFSLPQPIFSLPSTPTPSNSPSLAGWISNECLCCAAWQGVVMTDISHTTEGSISAPMEK